MGGAVLVAVGAEPGAQCTLIVVLALVLVPGSF